MRLNPAAIVTATADRRQAISESPGQTTGRSANTFASRTGGATAELMKSDQRRRRRPFVDIAVKTCLVRLAAHTSYYCRQ